jgi:hypothetical protein
MADSKETSFKNTISSTLSLITVLYEDLFEAIIIHRDFSGEKVDPKSSISLLNKTDKLYGYYFNIDIITDEVNALQKELLMLFEGYWLLHLWLQGILQKFARILVEVNKTIYGNNEDVPRELMDIFLLGSPGIINHMIWQGGCIDPVFPQSYRTILKKQEFIIHNSVTRPVQYSLPTMITSQPFMTNLELDEIESILMITSKIISNQVKWVMWYNKKKNLQHHTV